MADDGPLPRSDDPVPLDHLACGFVAAYRRALGGMVHVVDGIPWLEVGRSTVMAIPAATVHPVSRDGLADVLRVTGRALAQFATMGETGWPCTLACLRDRSYSEVSLQRQFRQRMERGGRRFGFRPLSWSELGSLGPDVLACAATQERKKIRFDRRLWHEACELGASDPRFIVFGCLRSATLVGFAVFLRHPAWYQAMDMVCHPDSFGDGSANLLLFRGAGELIRRPGCEAVCFGRSGIPHVDGRARFLRHGGIGGEPIRVAAALHPRWSWLGWSGTAADLLGRFPGLPASLAAGLAVARATDLSLLPRSRRSTPRPGHRSASP